GADSGIALKPDRAAIGLVGGGYVSELREKAGARCPKRLIIGKLLLFCQSVERREPGGCAFCFSERDRAIHSDDGRSGEREQRFIKMFDRGPIGAACFSPH